MGGYAAIRVGLALGAQATLTFAPQVGARIGRSVGRSVGYIYGGEATDTVYAQTRTPLGTHRHTDS